MINSSLRRPVVAGTDIKVSQIAREYAIHKMPALEIVKSHPHLSLAQVNAALIFYDENQELIHADWVESDLFAERMRIIYPVI